MAFRLYLVPKVLVVDVYKPKYFADGTVTGNWAGTDYEDWYLLGADLSGAQDAILAGQADVTSLPLNLSATLTAGQVTATQTKLEAANLPAGWITTSYTWVQVVRIVCGIMHLVQRTRGKNDNASILGGGITLNSTVGDLAGPVRQRLQDAASEMGIDATDIALGTTLRVVLKNVGTQLQSRPLKFGDVTL
jgi:hypothetical protein